MIIEEPTGSSRDKNSGKDYWSWCACVVCCYGNISSIEAFVTWEHQGWCSTSGRYLVRTAEPHGQHPSSDVLLSSIPWSRRPLRCCPCFRSSGTKGSWFHIPETTWNTVIWYVLHWNNFKQDGLLVTSEFVEVIVSYKHDHMIYFVLLLLCYYGNTALHPGTNNNNRVRMKKGYLLT